MQQTHKLRGFKSQYKKPAIVNLGDLSNNFNDGDIVTPAKLIQRGLIKSRRYGVKILGNGELTKKITIKDCQMSKSVAAKIVKN
jgi:large subunit ribosomal protein L15